jgi:glycosyltransferase involved in cell wall biosynthesis
VDFTIVVPTYNRPAELAGCLRSLAALDWPKDAYEVVVVDDGGTCDLGAALGAAAAAVPVRLVAQRNRGPGAARNAGARIARGRWIAFTDDDCRPRPGWLSGLRAALEGGADVLAGGRTRNQLPGNPYSTASQLVIDAAYAYFNRDRDRGRFVASNNAGVDRAEFLAAGGFDERFRVASEDRDLCDRWVWGGRRIVWTDAAVVDHRHELTFPGFIRQHYAYGRGAARYHRMRARRGSGRLRDQLSFQLHWWTLLLRPALASPRPAAALALLASWQAANTAGYLREALARLGRQRRVS